MEYKYEIGQQLVDKKRDITITAKRTYETTTCKRKQYLYVCNKCGFDCTDFYRDGEYVDKYWIDESHLTTGTGCSCCFGRSVKDGINSLRTTHSSLCGNIVDDLDKHRYTFGSSKKIKVQCPNCNKERLYKISSFVNDIANNNFHCQHCSDKVPMGEKIMYTLLNYLNVDFTKEMTFKWSKRKRYDFYIHNHNIIIEIMGNQHTKGTFKHLSGKTLEQEKLNDEFKHNLAIKNGITNEHYICIDSYYSDFNYIIENIRLSHLSKIYDLDSVDWNKIKKDSVKSLLVEIGNYWNTHKNCNTLDIANVFHLSRPTATQYLKLGNQAGFCIYNEEESMKRRVNIYRNDTVNTATPIKCNENSLYFKSYGLCCRLSERIFGIQLNNSSIKSVLDGKYKQHRGFTFSYVSKEEFNNAIENGCQCYGSPFKLL